MKNLVTKPILTGGGILKFDLQKFAETILTPTKGTSLKDGSTIGVSFQDNFGTVSTLNLTYNAVNNSFSETHSGEVITTAGAYIDNNNIVIQY